jgi:hypothetical protein
VQRDCSAPGGSLRAVVVGPGRFGSEAEVWFRQTVDESAHAAGTTRLICWREEPRGTVTLPSDRPRCREDR